MVTGRAIKGKLAEKRKEMEEGLRKTGFDLCGEGQVIFLGHFEEGGYCMIVECKGPPEDFLADFINMANAEIKPIGLCPKDCTAHPQPSLVQPLRAR
jgi:hypothetical protein